MSISRQRCAWVGTGDTYIAYHDEEWGVPVHDEAALFECLTLEGAQAGLSWRTILAKRDNYREAFMDFDPVRVAKFGKRERNRLLNNEGIVRNRLKIDATINNAKIISAMHANGQSLDDFFWRFVDHKPIQSKRESLDSTPAQTDLSKTISKELKRQGFKFIGPTIIYAFMQAIGMVNDHSIDCFRTKAVSRMR